LATSKEAKITIAANNKLSKDEIAKLKKESQQFAEADKKKLEEAELKNEADNLIYAAEKLVQHDLKDKIKPDQTEKMNKAIQDLRNAISTNNIDEIKNKTQALKNITGEISSEAYRQASAAQTVSEPTAGSSDPDGASTSAQGPAVNQEERHDSSGPT
jgi:molecular chaperone DnaK